MMNYDEEMNVQVNVAPDVMDSTKAQEKSFRKAAALVGVVLLLVVAATTSTLGGMPTDRSSPLFDRRLKGSSVGGSTTTYSSSDVAAHATAGDCWTSISGKVYDITGLLSKHVSSSGGTSLEDICGKDGSSKYQTGHSSNAKDLSSYLKGDLA